MTSVADFPRVLFVTPLAFNHFTGGGVTFTNLFRGWPKDRLFTVHADTLPLSTDTCVNYFALGAEELPLAGPLQALRRLVGRGDAGASAAGAAPADVVIQSTPDATTSSGRGRRLLFKGVHAIFGNSGLPVSARLSSRLSAWIEAARPDVIYTILGSIEMMELVEKIRVHFDVPVVVHLMDDWRAERERYGLLSPLRRWRLNKYFERSIRTASGHLAICDAMASVYGAEFGVHFEAIQNVIDSDDWFRVARQDVTPGNPARLLYAGSIYPNVQLSGLMEIAAAVARLREKGVAVAFDVMAPDFMVAPYRSKLEACDGTRVRPQCMRDQYFATICGADLLVLPTNFEAGAKRMVQYSMPTKVPEYLVSGVPILLYGPAGIAQIEYAEEAGWGVTVTQQEPRILDAALERIVEDRAQRRDLVRKARETATERHDATKVRAAFRSILSRSKERRQHLLLCG